MERNLELVKTQVRLRNNDQVVGYMRTNGNTKYYSKDGYSWNGFEIAHLQEDACSGYKDKNNKVLYEHDIVDLKFPDGNRYFYRIVLHGKVWKLLSLSSNEEKPIDHIENATSVTFISYDFLNPEMFINSPFN